MTVQIIINHISIQLLQANPSLPTQLFHRMAEADLDYATILQSVELASRCLFTEGCFTRCSQAFWTFDDFDQDLITHADQSIQRGCTFSIPLRDVHEQIASWPQINHNTNLFHCRHPISQARLMIQVTGSPQMSTGSICACCESN